MTKSARTFIGLFVEQRLQGRPWTDLARHCGISLQFLSQHMRQYSGQQRRTVSKKIVAGVESFFTLNSHEAALLHWAVYLDNLFLFEGETVNPAFTEEIRLLALQQLELAPSG